MKHITKTILASASPRRRELLSLLGIDFEVRPAKGEESVDTAVPEEIVQTLAHQKAIEIAWEIIKEQEEQKISLKDECIRIIGSDTIVVYEDRVFGKPQDEKDALRMLMCLQGNTHQVYTGVCVIDVYLDDTVVFEGTLHHNVESMKIKTFAEKTDVVMYPASEAELKDYIATGEPMDKAGAYAIQGISSKFIKEIHGDYYNVVGLPIARLYQTCYK